MRHLRFFPPGMISCKEGRILTTLLYCQPSRGMKKKRQVPVPPLITKDQLLANAREKLSNSDSKHAARKLIGLCNNVIDEPESSRVDLLRHVMSEIKAHGHSIDIKQYNTMLGILVHQRLPYDPIEFLQDMGELEANDAIRMNLLRSFAIKGDIDMAFGLLKQVEGENRLSLYGWLVHAYLRKGETEKADILLNDAKLKFGPNLPLYEPSIYFYAERGDLRNLSETIYEMDRSNLSPSTDIYVGMLEHLAYGKHVPLLEAVMSNIDDIERLANENNWSLMMIRCMVRQDYEAARIFINRVTGEARDRLRLVEEQLSSRESSASIKDIRFRLTI